MERVARLLEDACEKYDGYAEVPSAIMGGTRVTHCSDSMGQSGENYELHGLFIEES